MPTTEERLAKLEKEFRILNDFCFLTLYPRISKLDRSAAPDPVHQLPVNVPDPDRHAGHDFGNPTNTAG